MNCEFQVTVTARIRGMTYGLFRRNKIEPPFDAFQSGIQGIDPR